jgi:N-acetylmuramate 1-kinase
VSEPNADRTTALFAWAAECLAPCAAEWRPLSGDASFRRFYRGNLAPAFRIADREHTTVVAMDAPPATENNEQFVALSAWFRRHGIRVPAVVASDMERGFLLVEDVGDDLLGRVYCTPQRDLALAAAVDLLVRLQCVPNDEGLVPPYAATRFFDELELFRTWLVERLLGLTPSPGARALLDRAFAQLVAATTAQPQCLVHRDFHSRNLLLQADGAIAPVDFQDALWGPVSYDLVSLLRDCYVRFDDDEIDRWKARYLTLARSAGIPGTEDASTFTRWFDRTGVQRQLKAVGIFARLHLRDGKNHYLPVITPVLEQLVAVTGHDPEFAPLSAWLGATVLPAARRRLVLEGRAERPT